MKIHNFNIKEEDKTHDCVLIEREISAIKMVTLHTQKQLVILRVLR